MEKQNVLCTRLLVMQLHQLHHYLSVTLLRVLLTI